MRNPNAPPPLNLELQAEDWHYLNIIADYAPEYKRHPIQVDRYMVLLNFARKAEVSQPAVRLMGFYMLGLIPRA